jgi:bifunctional lysine-specific demethylase and histidyl-hydroxylase NO66
VTTAATRRTPPTPATTLATTAATTPTDALGLTLDPVGAEAFRSEHFDRRPLLVAREEPGRFDAILSSADVERIVGEGGLRTPAFRLVRDGAALPAGSYTEDVPWRPGRFSGLARVDRVAAEHADGATIVLQALHLHRHPAAVYCRGLEQALGFPVQANAYATPAAARGFAVHHDTHDVFVLQVAGSKHWRIYAPVVELPLKSQRWSPALGDPGAPVIDVTLRAGDTLYVPRGWPHEAVTDAADSLHLTIGLHPPTRLDALRAALDACAGDVEFRRALDADGALPDGLLARLSAELAPGRVAARTRRRFVGGRRAILGDQLSQARRAATLAAGDPVERRPTVIAELDGASLRFEGKVVTVPARAAGALAAACAHEEAFTAAELPGPLDESGRLVLVRRLVREGFLRAP